MSLKFPIRLLGKRAPSGGDVPFATSLYDSGENLLVSIETDIPPVWNDFNTSYNATRLEIGTSCTSIGSRAFDRCNGLTGSLVIPNSVTIIGSYTFFGCSGLTGDLVIPDGVTSIGTAAFDLCSGFTGTLTIPNSVTFISGTAFDRCLGLTNVDCYVEKFVLDGSNTIKDSGVTTIHARSTDGTWTAGAGQTIGGKTGIEVIKDL